jgi:hypothetical protein
VVAGVTKTPDVPKGAPSDQAAFDKTVKTAQHAADGANELEIVKIRDQRNDAMCKVLPGDLKVTDWVGTVHDVATNLGGDSGVLSLYIGKDIKASTTNNGLSDLGAHTLIGTDSPLYDSLATLSDGDHVVFSGQFIGDGDRCIEEQSVFDVNGVKTPDFLFRFSAVKKK